MTNVTYVLTDKVNFTEVPGAFQPPGASSDFPTIYGNTEFGFTAVFDISAGEGDTATYEIIKAVCIDNPIYTIAVSGPDSNTDNIADNEVRIERDPDEIVFPGESFEFVKYGYDKEGDDLIVANTSQFPDFPENPNDISGDANTTPVANTGFPSIDENDIDPNATLFPNETVEYGKFESYEPNDTDLADSDTSVYAWITPPNLIVSGSFTFEITYIKEEENGTTEEETITISIGQTYHWNWVPGIEKMLGLVGRSKF